jgi:hypothetical protein
MSFPVEDSDYEPMGLAYQQIELDRLNETLKKHNISVDLRRAICDDYFFEDGYFRDACSFRVSGKRVFPTLCFAERHVNRPGILDIIRLYVPNQGYSFHEYHDVTSYFDEKNEDITDIEVIYP